MELLSNRTIQRNARSNPTLHNYLKAMEDFVAEAKANPEKDYLEILCLASQGYSVGGFQEVLIPYYDPDTMFY